ncbi:hypothetical protein EVAR_9958_1 [Eumeta japonica]|uniref:Uncharacterized protein n=1 Tax=Eumeta variegata TaxID=151549 RepID=A0A4C1TQW8_EUMVA|nr:hypothetical protein EVAR_9958_1 [Eumeta japonica]
MANGGARGTTLLRVRVRNPQSIRLVERTSSTAPGLNGPAPRRSAAANGYGTRLMTSMSTAHVVYVAIACLILSAVPELHRAGADGLCSNASVSNEMIMGGYVAAEGQMKPATQQMV